MANSIESIDYNILENRILKIVEKITKNRNIPCYRNIYIFLIRGNFSIEDNERRLFIDGLLEDILITSENMSTNDNMSTDDNLSLNSFINYKFYEILTERIKCEVVKCVELKLSNYSISNIPIEVNESAEVIQCKDNDLK